MTMLAVSLNDSLFGTTASETFHAGTLDCAPFAARTARSAAAVRASNAELVALLSAVARGDRNAFASLYQYTAPRLYAVALRLLRRRELADEVVQDVYISVWTRAADYNPALASPLVWLSAIVRNRALDQIRRPAIEERWPDGDGDEDPLAAVAGDTPDPLAYLVSGRDNAALRTALAALPGHYRQAIALGYVEGLAHPEIAARLQVPLGTAKTWVRRGVELLRRALQTPTRANVPTGGTLGWRDSRKSDRRSQ